MSIPSDYIIIALDSPYGSSGVGEVVRQPNFKPGRWWDAFEHTKGLDSDRVKTVWIEGVLRCDGPLNWETVPKFKDNTLFYSSELSGPDGCHVCIFAGPDTTAEHLRAAKVFVRHERDVTGISVINITRWCHKPEEKSDE